MCKVNFNVRVLWHCGPKQNVDILKIQMALLLQVQNEKFELLLKWVGGNQCVYKMNTQMYSENFDFNF